MSGAFFALLVVEDGLHIVARAEGVLAVEDQLVWRRVHALVLGEDLNIVVVALSSVSPNLEGLPGAEDEVFREGVDDLFLAVDLPLELPFADVLVFGPVGVLEGDELPVWGGLLNGDISLG